MTTVTGQTPLPKTSLHHPEPEDTTTMTTPRQHPPDRGRQLDNARRGARRTVFVLARDSGARVIRRPAYRGSPGEIQDVEPLAGMSAARNLEIGARHTARDYIRTARETGHTWTDIGTALNLKPGADPQQAGGTIAEAAYTYATGSPDTEHAIRYGRSFIWTCRSCDSLISDQELGNGPADDEHGHAPDCRRHAAVIAAWQAEWESGWEAGE